MLEEQVHKKQKEYWETYEKAADYLSKNAAKNYETLFGEKPNEVLIEEGVKNKGK